MIRVRRDSKAPVKREVTITGGYGVLVDGCDAQLVKSSQKALDANWLRAAIMDLAIFAGHYFGKRCETSEEGCVVCEQYQSIEGTFALLEEALTLLGVDALTRQSFHEVCIGNGNGLS